jgi:putative ABC transport system permease protein
MLQDFGRDLRAAFRRIARSRLYAAAMIAVVGVGIAVNVATFGLIDDTVLQPLPYHKPGELAMLWWGSRVDASNRGLITPATLLGWRRRFARSLGDIAGILRWQSNVDAQVDLRVEDYTERLDAALATPNLFQVLGIAASRGRVFEGTDESGPRTVVLSDALWRRVFGADLAIIGKSIDLRMGRVERVQSPAIVIGILPPNVHFSYPEEVQLWVMMPWSEVAAYPADAASFEGVVRLRDAARLPEANQRIATFRDGIDNDAGTNSVVRLESMHDWIMRDTERPVALLGVTSLFLLVAACATVANGLVARLVVRRRELGVRMALGASASRLIREIFAEVAVLTATGAAVGVVVVALGAPLYDTSIPTTISLITRLQLNLRLSVAAVLTALSCIFVVGLCGAAFVTRLPIVDAIHAGRGVSARPAARLLRRFLICAQATMATVLLSAGMILLQSFWRLQHVPLGFEPGELTTIETRLLGRDYTPVRLSAIREQSIVALKQLPGVTSVSVASSVPFRGTDLMAYVTVPGSSDRVGVNQRIVDERFFDILRIPISHGRVFTADDAAGTAPVAIISRSLARRLFGATNPLGRVVHFRRDLRVVGVVGDVRYKSPDRDATPAIYLPVRQAPSRLMCFLLTTNRAGALSTADIRRAIGIVDPTIPLVRVGSTRYALRATQATRRFYSAVTWGFAVIALSIMFFGLLATLNQLIAQRRRDVGIRLALGGAPLRIGFQATRDSLAALVAGLALGLTLAVSTFSTIEPLLFGIKATPFVVPLAVAVVILATGTAAALWPVANIARQAVAVVLMDGD